MGGDPSGLDGYSRFGVMGSSEVSDGLSAVYRFEHKLDSTNASLDGGGRLSYVGLSGGFGTISVGQIWSASYNSVGAITDNSNLWGTSETSYRSGNALSYALSSGNMSMQIDAIMDGSEGKTGNNIDQLEFGLTVDIGEVGKVAFAHKRVEDSTKRVASTTYTSVSTLNGAVTPVSTLDVSPVVSTLDVSPVVSTLDVSPVVSTLDVSPVVSTLDVSPVVSTIDVSPVVSTIDVSPVTDNFVVSKVSLEGSQTLAVKLANLDFRSGEQPNSVLLWNCDSAGDEKVSEPCDADDVTNKMAVYDQNNNQLTRPSGDKPLARDEDGNLVPTSTGLATVNNAYPFSAVEKITHHYEPVGGQQVPVTQRLIWKVIDESVDFVDENSDGTDDKCVGDTATATDCQEMVRYVDADGALVDNDDVTLTHVGIVEIDRGSLDVKGGKLTGTVSGGELTGTVSGGELTGTVSGGELTGTVSGGELTGTVSGGELTGTVSGGELTGTVSGGELTGTVTLNNELEVTTTTTKNPDTVDNENGSVTNFLAAEFALGTVTGYVGWSEKKENNTDNTSNTTYVGARGSLGDTGMSYVFQLRNKDDSSPWILALNKSLGGGASLHFEHSNPDKKGSSSMNGVFMKVNF